VVAVAVEGGYPFREEREGWMDGWMDGGMETELVL
jgi:hypothetical protein